MTAAYPMESSAETLRLVRQANVDPLEQRLLRSGLREGMRALDAGCGPGTTTRAIARVVGASGSCVGIDFSAERIAHASSGEAKTNLQFQQGDVRKLPFADGSFDFVYCQFVLEYFADRAPVLAELLRVCRRGGRVVLVDVDNSGFLNWPFPEELQRGLKLIEEALRSTGFDPHVGRKLFTELRAQGVGDVRVQLDTHYVHAGAADARSVEDWRVRFNALEALAAPSFGGQAAYRAFADAFLRFWESPDSLKYSVLLITEGVKR